MDETTHTHFRSWKKGKTWLYAASTLLALTITGGATTYAKADLTTPTASITNSTTSTDSLSSSVATSTTPVVDSATTATSSAATSANNTISSSSATTSGLNSSASTASSDSSSTTSSSSQVTSQAPLQVSLTSNSSATSLAASSSAVDSSLSLASLQATSLSSNSINSSLAISSNALSSTAAIPMATLATTTSASTGSTSGTVPGTDTTTLYQTSTKEFATIAADALTVSADYTKNFPNAQPLKTGDYIYENADKTGFVYQVVASVDSNDPASGYPQNGMQAMAVAPVINGAADTSKIIITYAPTNPFTVLTEPADWMSNLEMVVGGSSTFTAPDGSQVPNQAITAKDFANTVMTQYAGSSFAFTGMSTGGYLAQAVAASVKEPAVAFFAPDPANIMPASDIAYVQAHPELYYNVRNSADLLLGAYGGNTLNTAIYYDLGFAGLVSGQMTGLSFNQDGSLSASGSPVLGPLLNDLVTTPDFAVSSLASDMTQILPSAANLAGVANNLADGLTFGGISALENTLSNLAAQAGTTTAAAIGSTLQGLQNAISGAQSLINNVLGISNAPQVISTTDIPDTTTLTSTTTKQFFSIASLSMLVGQIYVQNHMTFPDFVAPSLTAFTDGTRPLQVGDIINENLDKSGQAYQVIAAIDSDQPNSGYPANGFQAMAVAPIVNGTVDTSRIIVAFVGTDDVEPKDWLTDFEMVIGGNWTTYTDGYVTLPSQAVSAQQLVDTLKAQYPSSSFTLTGISLGGYLAQAVGAMEHLPVVAFVGPNPSNILTPAETAYVQAHPNLYFDYRSMWDLLLGKYGGNGLNDTRFYNTGDQGILATHWPTQFTFNADGSLSNPTEPINGPLVDTYMTLPDLILSPLASAISNSFPVTVPLVNATTAAVTAVTDTVTAATNATVSVVTPIVTSTLDAVNTAATTVVDTATNAVNTTATAVVDTATSAVNTVTTAVTNTVNATANAIANTTTSLINTVTSLWPW